MPHKSLEQLDQELLIAKNQIKVNGIYSHYKNPDNLYKVSDLAVQEATDKICVIYEALYHSGVTFVRDLDNWLEQVEIDGQKVDRFKLSEF